MVWFFTDACVLGQKNGSEISLIHTQHPHSLRSVEFSYEKYGYHLQRLLFLKISGSPAFHQLLLQKRAIERCSSFYKIKFAMNCTCHWRLRSIHFPPFDDSRNTLQEPWTWSKIDVWTTAYLCTSKIWEWTIRTLLRLQASKQLFVPHTMQTTFWENWVEEYAWLGVRWAAHLPRRPLTFAKGSDASELGPKNHLYS